MLTTVNRPICSRRRLAGGVTLIELMVTLALLGILLALGFPSFSAWIHNSQVRTVGEALQNGLRLAQAEALRLNRTVVMSFTNTATAPLSSAANWTAAANGRNWWIQTVAQYGDTAANPIASGTFTDVASGVQIAGVSAVCFNSNGRVVGTPAGGTGVSGANCTAGSTSFGITQSGADRNLQVTLAVGGQVRLCDPKRTLSSSTPDGC